MVTELGTISLELGDPVALTFVELITRAFFKHTNDRRFIE